MKAGAKEAKVTCIICAYNEARTLSAVLAVASTHPLIAEVIVIDDGSTDHTLAIVESYPSVRIIVHHGNLGKSQAMADGIGAATHDLLLFLDADLVGLGAVDITRLIEPVLTRAAMASLSLRQNSLRIYRALGIDFLSGERVLPRNVLGAHIDSIRALPRFGVEVFINRRILEAGASIAVVDWPGVAHRTKVMKMGWLIGLTHELRMIRDICRCIRPIDAIGQALLLRSRRI